MDVIAPSSEGEMIAIFLRAELDSAGRFAGAVADALRRHGADPRVITSPSLEHDEENGLRRRILDEARGYSRREGLFAGFPGDVRWQRVALTRAELAAVRYIDYDYWVELSGGSRLATDAALLVRAGVAPFGVQSDWALALARALAEGARLPPLILVTDGCPDGLVVLEGHARLTAYMLEPQALPPELEVLVGASREMSGWGLY